MLYREETRAARLTLLIVLVVGLTWAPHTASLITPATLSGQLYVRMLDVKKTKSKIKNIFFFYTMDWE